MTDLTSGDALLISPSPGVQVGRPPEPAVVLPDAAERTDSREVEVLRTELAVVKERLRAVEELARERASRIADLRVILRMLPAATQGAGAAADPSPSSLIWVPDRAGTAGGPTFGPGRASGAWSPFGSVPRQDQHSERIWQSSESEDADAEPAAAASRSAPSTPAEPDVSPPARAVQSPGGDWREDFRDFARPRHRRARMQPWLWRLRWRRTRSVRGGRGG